jgi:hypothetical protein
MGGSRKWRWWAISAFALVVSTLLFVSRSLPSRDAGTDSLAVQLPGPAVQTEAPALPETTKLEEPSALDQVTRTEVFIPSGGEAHPVAAPAPLSSLPNRDFDKMSREELQALHDSVRHEVMKLTDQKLIDRIQGGLGELISTDSKAKYKYTPEDFQSIVMIYSDPTRGLIRAVLPRHGNEEAYELHELQLSLSELIKERRSTVASGEPR